MIQTIHQQGTKKQEQFCVCRVADSSLENLLTHSRRQTTEHQTTVIGINKGKDHSKVLNPLPATAGCFPHATHLPAGVVPIFTPWAGSPNQQISNMIIMTSLVAHQMSHTKKNVNLSGKMNELVGNSEFSVLLGVNNATQKLIFLPLG